MNLLSHGNYTLYEPREMMDENKEHFSPHFARIYPALPVQSRLIQRGREQLRGEMTEDNQIQLGRIVWNIADQLRVAMNADVFRDVSDYDAGV